MERQLELEEAHKAKEEAKMAMLEVNKLKQEADKKIEKESINKQKIPLNKLNLKQKERMLQKNRLRI